MIRIKRKPWALGSLVALGALMLAGPAAAQQAPAGSAFHASHYEVDATLRPAKHMLTATVRADFVAGEPSGSLQVELNPNLKIGSIQMGGNPLPFSRVPGDPLDVTITLPETAAAGQTVTLDFQYSGPLSGDQASPSPGVQLAYIGAKNIYLLRAARWFPLVSYVGERYTAVFNLTLPGNFALVGSGTGEAPSSVNPPPPLAPAGMGPSQGQGSGQAQDQMQQGEGQGQSQGQTESQGQWLRYTFTTDRPGPVGTFVAGALELSPETVGGIPISVYTLPTQKSMASDYAEKLAEIVAFFSSEFGPLPEHSFTIAQLPTEAPMDGVWAPGLLLINQRQWSQLPPDQLLARLVAHQWWDDQVMPATPADVWLSGGLSKYAAVLYQEHTRGDSGLRKAVHDCAVGALMNESAAPIAQAGRLQPYTTAYLSVVRDKGAMVFHMLRSSIGDTAFLGLLREYLQKYAGKTATLDDFESLTQTQVASLPGGGTAYQAPPLNTVAFFSQWLNSTGIPRFQLQYTVYRTQKGFKVVGKIKQNLTTLNMPIQVRVETEGNPVTKTIQVVGDSTEFVVDTFGQPKSGGILLDPNSNVLKDTPNLRVEALIAHGVALAEKGQFFQAIRQYQKALEVQRHNGLALFRMGEAFFYEKNYQAAANSFRDALDGQIDPSFKWIEVWAHIYLGKIYDLIGQRERALNEYQKALDTKDNTAGALDQARAYMKTPYGSRPAAAKPVAKPAPKSGAKPAAKPATKPAAPPSAKSGK